MVYESISKLTPKLDIYIHYRIFLNRYIVFDERLLLIIVVFQFLQKAVS
jgi:hypothetical protein